MKIIVGLGNPTSRYAGTRHNVGFSVIYELSDTYNIKVDTNKHKAMIGKGMIGGEKVVLAMPMTYMNLSGESVREIINYYKCDISDLIVVYDDISLDVGKIRIRGKGSAGGHNGIKNIIQHLGSDSFARVKVGVGEKPKNMDLADYVLGRFSKEEQPIIRESVKRASEAVYTMIADNIDVAMNKFN